MKTRRFLSLLLVIVLMFAMISCGKGADKSDVAEQPNSASKLDGAQVYGSLTDEMAAPSGSGKTEVRPDDGRKVIYHVRMMLESKEYDSAKEAVKALAASLGGYLESSSESGRKYDSNAARSAQFVFRVPSDAYRDFMEKSGELCNIVSSSVSSDDVTDSYYDTTARLESRRVQEERLLSLLKECKSLSEMLEIEDKLSNVRYEIERLEGTLVAYDKNVAYSTVSVTLNEVKEYTAPASPSYWAQISDAFAEGFGSFVDFLRGLSVAVIFLLPWLILAAVIAVPAVIFGKKNRRKKAEEKKAALARQAAYGEQLLRAQQQTPPEQK